MPVILAEEDWAKWLGEEPATNDELKALLVPFKDDALRSIDRRSAMSVIRTAKWCYWS
jgi:putative SOS response-associated peptidase YedK